MEIEWDPVKNERNVTKHGVSFESAARVFGKRMIQWRNPRADYQEERWTGLAELDGRVLLVVWTMRGPGRYRLISARKANGREATKFRTQTSAPETPSHGSDEP